MISSIEQRHWAPYEPVLSKIEAIASEYDRIVEIGSGPRPFAKAREFVDWQVFQGMEDKTVHALDINCDPLPFEDKSVDFIYCRHTLEDIYNPIWACKEIARVAKAGYIETPSPIAECCRGVDGGTPAPSWRGYHHHRYVIWSDGSALNFVPKYPIIECLDFQEQEGHFVSLLNASPLYWNTYFLWEGALEIKFFQHGRNFLIHKNYETMLVEACAASAEECVKLALNYHIPF